MFCAFEGPPRILRLFGVGMCLVRAYMLCSLNLAVPFVLRAGTVHDYGSSEYNRLIPVASRRPGSRAAIVIDVYQVGSVRSRLLCITREAHRVRL